MTDTRLLRVVVASPSDVQEERDALPGVLEEINRGIARAHGVRLELYRWETDAYPGFHLEGPQGLIDAVLNIEDSDILIGIFWKRFGTPVPDAQSGTEHEFHRACAAWRDSNGRRPQIMVYFNQQGFEPKTYEEAKQFALVLQFREKFPKEGLWWPYKGKADFEKQVRGHLTQFILRHVPRPDEEDHRLPRTAVTILAARIDDVGQMIIGLGQGVYNERIREPYRRRVRAAIQRRGGTEFDDTEDEMLVRFERAEDAIACAVDIQAALSGTSITAAAASGGSWTIKARVGVHTAEVADSSTTSRDLVGRDVETARRMAWLALSKQIIVSASAYQMARNGRDRRWQEWRNRCIDGFNRSDVVWELLWDGGGSRGEPGSAWIPPRDNPGPSCYISRLKKEECVLSQLGGSLRLAVIHGACGTGKTRLALACGVRAAGMFRDGVVFVSLDGKERSEKAVAGAIGIALGVTAAPPQPESLFGMLREKHLLIILDNYEHVACVQVAAYLRKLLTEGKDLRLLVSGRERFPSGDHAVLISLDDGMEAEEAQALFKAHAMYADPHFELDAAGQQSLDRIIELTECNPRAIELAAAWVRDRSLEGIADGLQATPLPESRDDCEDARYRNLRRSLDCSLNLLEPSARDAFVRLGLFPQTFTAQAFAEICEVRDAPCLLDYLENAALVRRFHINGSSRYGMHRSTHAYAREKLLASLELTQTNIYRRFVEYFARLSEMCNPLIHQRGAAAAEILAAVQQVETEWGNVCCAVRRAFENELWESFIQLSRLVLAFVLKRGHWHDAEVLYNELRQRCQSTARENIAQTARAEVLNILGVIYQFERRWEEAEQVLLECEPLQDGLAKAKTQNSLGTVCQEQDKWDKAAEWHHDSLALCKKLKEREEEARTLANLGLVYERLGEAARAKETLLESLSVWKGVRELSGLADVYNSLGRLCQDREEFPEALTWYQRRLDQVNRIGDLTGKARTLNSIGYVHRRLRQHKESEECHKAALRICELIGDTVEEVSAHTNLGQLYDLQRRFDKAVMEFESAVAMQHGSEKAKGLNFAGWMYERQRDVQKALDRYEYARSISEAVGDWDEERRASDNIERVKNDQFCSVTDRAPRLPPQRGGTEKETSH